MFKEARYVQAMWNPAKQINDVEDLITRGIDLLFLMPVSEAAMVSSVERAMERGIPVVLHGAKARTSRYVTYMDRDNPRVGYQYGEWLAKQLAGKGNIVIFMGLAGNTYAEDVLRGARESLQSHGEMKEVGLAWASWSPVQAKKAMEAFIQKHPKIDGVLSDGGQMGLGCVEAFLDAKKPIPFITGDDWNGWLRLAKQHNIKFLAASGGADQGLDVVDIGVKVLRGEPVPKTILKEAVTFDHTQIDRYLRQDLDDRYWAINQLPEAWIQRLYKKK
jgi:ribose transport system substrate-binding protein